ncbi:MAG: aldehyde dehydrogenase family protein [Azospirillaceae bacterium]|nr:aldehyde dehydrogenase family protein [Azospirillaceae bacterium]
MAPTIPPTGPNAAGDDLAPQLDPHALADALSGRHLIGGQLVPAVSGKTFDVINPAHGTVMGRAAFGEAADVDAAVAAAVAAGPAWKDTPARERGRLVAECGRRLTAHAEELARLVALETGKALRTESRVEAGVLADAFTFFGGLGGELKGETVPFNPRMLTLTVREPLGLVGAIIPWNVPMMLMALKIAPALVAGNTVVVKSAEEAPFAVLRACQIMAQVLPTGVLNILSGFGPDCGAPLVAHPKVAKVTFTGSVETGRIVSKAAAEKLIPVTLELGGKSPMIVMGDADLDKAIAGAVSGMRFTRQGQSCTAASRIFVHDSLHDAFVTALKAKVDAMVMGDPLDEKTDIGTIVSPQQYDKVRGYIADGEASPGAVAHACSALPTDPALAQGLYVRPVIFTGMANDSRLAREEIFGPVTCVIRFTDYDDVINQANDSEYGLAATIWTRDLKTALDATHRLQAGFVQVNQNLVVQPNLSYGGVKSSGLGKEATLESMLEHFTHKKTIILNMG